MSENIIIRPERAEDFKKTEHMVLRAFWNIHGPGCNEHLLVRKIRTSPDYLPQISRVAEKDGKIVGAIYYTRAKVVDGDRIHEIITFGPLAVEPTLQNSGVGRLLLEETLRLARDVGYAGVCIYGEPYYYPKRGFVNCREFGITDPMGNNYDALMAYPLNAEAFSQIHGKLFESETFEKCGDENELAQMTAEFPAYPTVKIKEGFLQIYDQHFARVTAAENGRYTLAFWELSLPAEVNPEAFPENARRPAVGDTVLFTFKRDGTNVIESLCRLL